MPWSHIRDMYIMINGKGCGTVVGLGWEEVASTLGLVFNMEITGN